jgi:hypothetical protein
MFIEAAMESEVQELAGTRSLVMQNAARIDGAMKQSSASSTGSGSRLIVRGPRGLIMVSGSPAFQRKSSRLFPPSQQLYSALSITYVFSDKLIWFTSIGKAFGTETLSDIFLPAQGTSHYGGYWTPGDLLEAARVRPYPHKG